MKSLCLSVLLTLLLTPLAEAAPPPHVEVRLAESYFGGGTTLTLWSDGYVEEVAMPGGPRVDSYHWSGKVPKKALAKIVASLKTSSLAKERFTQQPKQPVLTEGGTSFEVWDGASLHRLSKPPLDEPNTATQALSAKIKAVSQEVREAVRPHLGRAGQAGRYVSVVLRAPAKGQGKAASDLPKALQAALARPGSYVRLPEATQDIVKQGQRATVDGREVTWLVRQLAHAEAPAAEAGR